MAANAEKAFSRTWVCWQSSKTFIDLPKYVMRVLIAIAQYQQGTYLPTYSTISYARITDVTRIGKADISHAIARLKEDGFIEVIRRTSKGTCYRLNPPPYAHDEEVAYVPNSVAEPPNSQVVLAHNSSVGNADNLSVGDGAQPIKNVINEITNQQEYANPGEVDPGFQALWRAWPAKRKQTEAEEMYSRVVACGVGAEMLLSIAEDYVRGFEGDYRFVPGLARWLDPDDIGGWIEGMREKRAQRRAALLRTVSDEELQAALAACDAKYAQLLKASEEDPFGSSDGRYTNRDKAYSYFVRHRQRAQDAVTRGKLDAAGLVDVKHLSAFD